MNVLEYLLSAECMSMLKWSAIELSQWQVEDSTGPALAPGRAGSAEGSPGTGCQALSVTLLFMIYTTNKILSYLLYFVKLHDNLRVIEKTLKYLLESQCLLDEEELK